MRLNLEVLKVVVELSSLFGLCAHPLLSATKVVLSTTEEFGKASISRSCAKREISALSAAVVLSQIQA